MAMSIAARDDSDPIADMNTTPLVDVMLVLLILFIITLPVMTNSTNVHIGRGEPPEPPPFRAKRSPCDRFRRHDPLERRRRQDLAQLEGYFAVEARQGQPG